jgi:hypothetical protein
MKGKSEFRFAAHGRGRRGKADNGEAQDQKADHAVIQSDAPAPGNAFAPQV